MDSYLGPAPPKIPKQGMYFPTGRGLDLEIPDLERGVIFRTCESFTASATK